MRGRVQSHTCRDLSRRNTHTGTVNTRDRDRSGLKHRLVVHTTRRPLSKRFVRSAKPGRFRASVFLTLLFFGLDLFDPRCRAPRLTYLPPKTKKNSGSNPLTTLFAKNPQLETVCYFALWYWLNIQFNIINKQIYNYFPFPWFVSAVHLAVGLLIMTFFWTTKIVKYEKPDADFLKACTLPAFLHAFGHCLTNVSFAAVAVSLTHTIKTLEPVFTSIGSFLVNGQVYAWPVYFALLPIIGGVALASATELSFSWLGFSTAMASNVAFSARAIFSKKLMQRMSPLNLYNFLTIISLLFCIPFVFLFEGSTLAAGIAKAVELKGQKEFILVLLKVGAFYHLYNQVAYQALGKVEPVTHAVGNVGKRIFVIGFTILAFGNKISMQTAIGSGIAVLGAGAYGFLKNKYAAETRTVKRD